MWVFALQLLEIPQLMDTCVRNGFYEEALQLEQFAQRFSKMHPDIKLVQDVVRDRFAVHTRAHASLSITHK